MTDFSSLRLAQALLFAAILAKRLAAVDIKPAALTLLEVTKMSYMVFHLVP